MALAENTVLDTIIMIPGEILEVSGDILTTTWTTSFVYYVTDDLTVPEGETLTIDPGVRVKFYSGTGMTVNGKLLANGTEDYPVRFTSKEPTPLPGDWDNLVLNGPDNVLTYLYYDYASDGITGSGADGTNIDNLKMFGTLTLAANGIVLENSKKLTLTNNIISTSNNYGIWANNARESIIDGNTIYGAYSSAAIYTENCDKCTISNNIIENNPEIGIMASGSDSIKFINNSMDVARDGIINDNAFHQLFLSNTILNFNNYGIRFNGARYCTTTTNTIISDRDGGEKFGVHGNTTWSGYNDTSFVDNHASLIR